MGVFRDIANLIRAIDGGLQLVNGVELGQYVVIIDEGLKPVNEWWSQLGLCGQRLPEKKGWIGRNQQNESNGGDRDVGVPGGGTRHGN